MSMWEVSGNGKAGTGHRWPGPGGIESEEELTAKSLDSR